MLSKVINLIKMRYITLILLSVSIFALFIIKNNLSDKTQSSIGGGFELINQQGDSFSNKDIKTKYMLVFFGFTNCHMICPTGMYNISDALALLNPNVLKNITPVFITVDPERDNPSVIKEFLKSFNQKFVGLTGDVAVLKDVEKRYGVFAKKDEPDDNNDYQVSHSAYIYLTYNNGEYIAHSFYNSSKEDLKSFIETNIK
jgi:cytochrome oxidase Cu insertion factor (SCO1/SenC/PrrC family)